MKGYIRDDGTIDQLEVQRYFEQLRRPFSSSGGLIVRVRYDRDREKYYLIAMPAQLPAVKLDLKENK